MKNNKLSKFAILDRTQMTLIKGGIDPPTGTGGSANCGKTSESGSTNSNYSRSNNCGGSNS